MELQIVISPIYARKRQDAFRNAEAAAAGEAAENPIRSRTATYSLLTGRRHKL